MKVLYLLDSLNRGGAEILALDVCRNARENGIELTFAATGGGKMEEDFRNSGVDFVRLNRRFPLDWRVVSELKRIIKTRQIQIVHAHQAVEGLHAYFAALRTKAKLVLSFHGFVPNAKNRFTLKFLIPRTAANVVVSRELLLWLGEQGFKTKRNFSVIYNGVDERRLKPSGKNLRQELNLSSEAKLFGMIGNFYAAPRKDQLTVCRALPEVFNQIENTHFVFVGANEENSDLERCVKFCRENKITERVHFLGVRTDVPNILNSLDIFVLSSLHEGLPISVIEAQLAGVPCVLSDIAPLLEISSGGSFAEIFQTGNHQDLAEKLVRLSQEVDFSQKLSARAQTWAQQSFSIEAHLASLKELYAKLI